MTKLDALLTLSFEEYMAGCWEHVRSLALKDSVAEVVYHEILSAPAAMEALWAATTSGALVMEDGLRITQPASNVQQTNNARH